LGAADSDGANNPSSAQNKSISIPLGAYPAGAAMQWVGGIATNALQKSLFFNKLKKYIFPVTRHF
jgi:hypothetical protein